MSVQESAKGKTLDKMEIEMLITVYFWNMHKWRIYKISWKRKEAQCCYTELYSRWPL